MKSIAELEDLSVFYLYSEDKKTRFIGLKQSRSYCTLLATQELIKGKWAKRKVLGKAKDHFCLNLDKLQGVLYVETTEKLEEIRKLGIFDQPIPVYL
jgi:hypothetical protein